MYVRLCARLEAARFVSELIQVAIHTGKTSVTVASATITRSALPPAHVPITLNHPFYDSYLMSHTLMPQRQNNARKGLSDRLSPVISLSHSLSLSLTLAMQGLDADDIAAA